MIKFECRHCSQPIEAPDEMSGMEVDCPGCARKVVVREKKNSGVMALIHRSRAENIRRNANILSAIAGLLAILGMLDVILSIIAIKSGEAGWSLLSVGALFGAALWFYLIAQVVHIRANTEK